MQLVVGRIGRAHGVRGDLFVEPFTDEPEVRFAAGNKLQTSATESLTVAEHKWHSGKLIVHFVGVEDRTAAENLRGTELFAQVDPALLPDDPDEFYDHQLVDLAVHFEDQVIGKVTEVIHLPAQDLLSVTKSDGTEVLIPFVKQIVPQVDIRQGRIVITPPPGLIDEHQAIEVRGEE